MEVKSGNKSTEFWMWVSVVFMVLANGTSYINVPWDTIMMVLGSSGVYTFGRSWVKGKSSV